MVWLIGLFNVGQLVLLRLSVNADLRFRNGSLAYR